MSLPRSELWIGGRLEPPAGKEYFDDLNPLDDSPLARIARGTADDVDRAVRNADETFREYRQSAPGERESWLLAAADLLSQQSDEFIRLLIDEIGSPISKARKEIASATGILRAAAGAARRLSGKTLPTDMPGRLSISTRRPIGVVAGMTPFNVPLIKAVKHTAMPLATGNTVVLLPSDSAPQIVIRLAQLYREAGIPAGAFNVVSGHGEEIGDALTTHPLVRMVAFTGSTLIGHHIRALCGQHGKRVRLEMGGKNPLVVMADADFERAVQAAVFGSFLFQGQICMASSRIYVQRSRFEPFIEAFAAAAGQLSVGDLDQPDTMIGPIINARQRDRVRGHLANALKLGAKRHVGGEWQQNRCLPTVLSRVPADALLYREETFGPISSVYAIDTLDEAIALANDSAYGLSASIFTSDLRAALTFAESVDAGMVHVNGATVQEEPHIPFGGCGDSGVGRETTDTDLEDLTEWKWITVQHG